tara:strand:+ start:57 stop:836 length:780 start_codon:yes stop_codon:yes gene_type:complete
MSEDRKVAIITGSSQGLGAAIAKKLSKRNVNIVINYSSNEDLAYKTRDECIDNGVNAISIKADVSKDDDCIRLVKETLNSYGKVDILVNNAGTTKFADHTKLDKLSDEDFINIYKVNVIGPYQMIRAVEPFMKKNGFGSVVNISSIAGKTGIGSSIAYAASKGALNTMTLSLAKALGPEIRVNTVCPGFIGTGWFENRFGKETYERIKKDQENITPLKKAGTPNDIADSAVFFCLEGSEHITGETLISDAGMHLNLPKG